jgi:CheY-like chemotaxis protein
MLMGSDLIIESVPNVGSKFGFDLTFNATDSSADAREREFALDQNERPFFEGEILLCEDNQMNQRVICEHFARVGLKVVVAENGEEGVNIVQSRMKNDEKPFDLIFMDVQMPIMDGLEATQAISRLGSKTPIIAMTANVMTSDRDFYKSSGMNDCMGKPFTSQELWSCLLKYLAPASLQNIKEDRLPQVDEKFQVKLLTCFVKDNQTKIKEITKAVDEGNIKLAHRLTHNLKSNASIIGKTELQEIAAAVEEMLKDGKNLVAEGDMKILETELNAVLKELAPLLDEAEAQARTAAPFAEEKAEEALYLLEPLLKCGNPECLDFIDDLRAIPGSELLVRQMEEFDFAHATATLAELKKKWGCVDNERNK